MGTFVAKRRVSAGYPSQVDFANAIGKSQSWVSRLERGAAKELPPPEDVELLAKFLNVSSAEIIAAAGYDVETGREGDSPAVSALRPILESRSFTDDQVTILASHIKSAVDLIKGK